MSTIATANALINEAKDALEAGRRVYIHVAEKWYQVTTLAHFSGVTEIAEASVVNDTRIVFDKAELVQIER